MSGQFPVKMKMGRPHAVPLSRQAIAIVREIEHDAEYSNFLFPSLRALDRPMSDNTINAALRRLGYPIAMVPRLRLICSDLPSRASARLTSQRTAP